MKEWFLKDEFKHGFILMFLFIVLDVSDARWFIPRMRPVCNGEITDQQARICSGWIRKINNKEQKNVRITNRGFGSCCGNPQTDANNE